MNFSRSSWAWWAFAVCGLLVIGAMGWLTRGVLRAEQERALAESRAELEERTRLALWRMDVAGAAWLAALGQSYPHPPADQADLVRLSFRVGPERTLRILGEETPERRAEQQRLQSLLSAQPASGQMLNQLKEAVCAWEAIPKEASLQIQDNRQIRQQDGQTKIRSNPSYQTNFNTLEKAQRAKAVEQSVGNGIASEGLQQQAFELASPQAEPMARRLNPMWAVWIGEELFLLRTSDADPFRGQEVEGLWLDATKVRKKLLAEVSDLLQVATLSPVPGKEAPGAAADPLAMVSLPFHLDRNEALVVERAPFSLPLAIGWTAMLLALVAAFLLVAGIMRLSERRASFVSAVTHELRTPLTTFRLYSDMLAGGAVREERKPEYLGVLSREADRLAHLVENVLAFSGIERGSARAVVKTMEVRELIEPLIERFESRLAAVGMRLDVRLGGVGDRQVRVDFTAVEQVLFNLMDNAAKYATTGGPGTVRLQAERRAGKIRICVIDQGPGVPRADLKRIFRPFHKSAAEAASTRPGVGLGLALSRRLARAMEGELTCEPTEGGGACFVLTLPEQASGS